MQGVAKPIPLFLVREMGLVEVREYGQKKTPLGWSGENSNLGYLTLDLQV